MVHICEKLPSSVAKMYENLMKKSRYVKILFALPKKKDKRSHFLGGDRH